MNLFFFKWIFRELRNNSRFTILFILNMGLGLMGFIALDAFKVSLRQVLNENSRNFLSADLSVSARRAIQKSELSVVEQALGQEYEVSHLWEFFSMTNSPRGSRLVQIKGIESNYPFYGQMTLGSGRVITGSSPKEIIEQNRIWVYPELLTQLHLKVGDSLRLGEADYVIADTVANDSSQTLRLSSLAPKVYIGRAQLETSGLIQKGTTFSDIYLFKLQNFNDDGTKAREIFSRIQDPAVQVTTPQDAGEDTARALKYLNDYLGLVSLIALFLSGIGAAYLYRSFFSVQLKSLAILNCLGMRVSAARRLLTVQILFMGLGASIAATLGALAVFPLLRALLREFSPLDIPLVLSPRILGISVVMATAGSLSVSLLFLVQLNRLRSSQLFHEEAVMTVPWKWWDISVLSIPLGLFWILSIWQANSIKIGSVFFGLMVASLAVVLVLNVGAIFLLARRTHFKNWIAKYVMLQLTRKKARTLSCCLALSLSSLLINILPQLKITLQKDFEAPSRATLPTLFLFDIQDDQAEVITHYLHSIGAQGLQISPMVRARILKVNDRDFEKIVEKSKLQTREEETEARFRNRGFNLSYRMQLDSSEKVVDGEFWRTPYDFSSGRLPQISVESQFAQRLKFKLGDTLTFDIQGVEVQGQITSLRSVHWNTFKPNFFVLFQPGSLEGAPKTFIASVSKGSSIPADRLQNSLVEKFPNVSIIDVGRVITKVLELLDKMSWSLQLMAVLCLVVGLMVLYSIISHQVSQGRWDLNLLKILGCDAGSSLLSLGLEFGFLGFLASCIGTVLSFAVVGTLSQSIFGISPVFSWQTPLSSIIVITALSSLIALMSAWQVIRQRPGLILQS